jgi:hypothetical protein
VPNEPRYGGLTLETLKLESFETRLRDGTPVLVRPIRPEDRSIIVEAFRRLSPQSRYTRFLAPIVELSDKELRHLTEIDYVDHMAWVALDPDHPDSTALGVARYVRLADDPDVAGKSVEELAAVGSGDRGPRGEGGGGRDGRGGGRGRDRASSRGSGRPRHRDPDRA